MTHRLDGLSRRACADLATAGAIAVLPLGSTEQHGPHLPTGTDTRLVDDIADEAVAEVARRVPIVLAPALPYGCSAHHLPFGGTGSVSAATYLSLLREVGGSLIESGFRRLFMLNGHGGNHHLMQAVVSELSLAHDAHVAAASWWLLGADALVETGALEGGNIPGHAGAFETSIMMARWPDAVASTLPQRDDAMPHKVAFGPEPVVESPEVWTAMDGWSDNPSAADPDAGRRYFEVCRRAVVRALTDFASRTGLATAEGGTA